MRITLATLAIQFLERPGITKSTIRSYESTLLPLLQQYGRSPIDTPTRRQLEEYLNSLKHLSYTTRNRHQAIIQSLFNFGVEQEHLASNPIARLARRKPNRELGERDTDEAIRYLNCEQLKLLYSFLEPNSRLHTLVLLLHQSGARIQEVLALDLTDIDRTNRQFQVIGKGNKQRWCFYGEDMAQVLEKYIRLYRHNAHPALFTAQQPCSLEITRLSYNSAYKDWKSVTQQSAELASFRLHDLRHTFATERVGVMGIEELRALMGHTNIQTT